jgi:hypothetical protein
MVVVSTNNIDKMKLFNLIKSCNCTYKESKIKPTTQQNFANYKGTHKLHINSIVESSSVKPKNQIRLEFPT